MNILPNCYSYGCTVGTNHCNCKSQLLFVTQTLMSESSVFLTIKRRNQAVYSMCVCDDPSIRAGKNEELRLV